MARANAVKRGKGVMHMGRMVSQRLLEKRLNAIKREIRKQDSANLIPFAGFYDWSKETKHLKYLESKGLINKKV